MDTFMNRYNRTERRYQGAFTLIEMLVVITIIGLLIALTVPALTRTMEANRLTAAGEGLMNRLSQAQQLASSRNQRMQIWFIHATAPDSIDPDATYRSYAICEVSANGQPPKIIAGPFPVESGIVLSDSPTLSPLLRDPNVPVPEQMASESDAKAAVLELSPDGGMRRMIGTASLVPQATPLAESFLTFLSDNPAELSAALPTNFYSVQIDPYTSRARSFRPMIGP